jgi:hypothetical protein
MRAGDDRGKRARYSSAADAWGEAARYPGWHAAGIRAMMEQHMGREAT